MIRHRLDLNRVIPVRGVLGISTIVKLASVGSTNDYIKTHRELWGENFCTVHALRQTSGRGRFSREWHSTDGDDLTFSTIFILPSSEKNFTGVTLYAGLAVYRVLKDIVGEELKLKWPNDIYYKGKKICGILCEYINNNGNSIIIIGVGININSEIFPEVLKEGVTSLKKITRVEYDITKILESVISQFKEVLTDYSFPIGEKILQEWMADTCSLDKEVYYEFEGKKHHGILRSINRDCSLNIYDKGLEKNIKYMGEVLFL